MASTGCECPKGLLSRSDLSGSTWRCPAVLTTVHIDRRHHVSLCSSTSDELCVPAVRLPTIGHRAFPVAGARIWNDLPADVTSAPSLLTFRKRLKLYLFRLSYPGLVL